METTVTVWNISEEERLGYVAQVQEETTRVMLPVMTFLIFLSVVGAVGNTLVLLVYYGGFKKGATRVLILFIAAVDLFSCLMVIPGEVYDMFHLWDWTNRGLCQARMFISGTSTVTSAMALLVVAVIRYRKVCHPFGWQVESRHARIAAILCLTLSVLASVPLAVVNGRQTKPLPATFTADVISRYMAEAHQKIYFNAILLDNDTDISGDTISVSFFNDTPTSLLTTTTTGQNYSGLVLYGHECTSDDSFTETIWPVVASGLLFLLFLASAIPLCTMYGLIGHKAWRHRKQFQVHHIGNSKGDVSSDGAALRVFRMLSSIRKKDTKSSSGGETTTNTNTTSCSGTTSSSKDENAQAETMMVSAISNGQITRSADNVQSSSDVDSVEPAQPVRKSPGTARKTSTPRTDATSADSLRFKQDKGNAKSKDNKIQSLQKDASEGEASDTSHEKNSNQPGSTNFVEISLTPRRSPAGDSSSEDLSDTNEDRKRFAKKSRKPSQNTLFKSLIKRSESGANLPERTTNSTKQSKFSRKKEKHKRGKPQVVSRTTIMLFTISTVYIVGYLSHLSMIFLKQGARDTFDTFGPVSLSLWNFFLRLYYVNCAANAVVYSLCDLNFRRNCITLFKKK